MSGKKYVLDLSQEAYDDLVNIQTYTFSEFGETQWDEYGHELDKGMNHILNFPHSGHKRKDIPKGYLAWPVREHIMIYRIEEEIIYIIRVLHGRMVPVSVLRNPSAWRCLVIKPADRCVETLTAGYVQLKVS